MCMGKEAFVAEMVARMVSEGSVAPSAVYTDVSRSTRERVVRVLVEEGWFKHHPDLRGSYVPGPRLRETARSAPCRDLAEPQTPEKRAHIAMGSQGQGGQDTGDGQAEKGEDQATEDQEPEIDLVPFLASREFLEKHYPKKHYPEDSEQGEC